MQEFREVWKEGWRLSTPNHGKDAGLRTTGERPACLSTKPKKRWEEERDEWFKGRAQTRYQGTDEVNCGT